mmetsp:Transcript_30765/g.100140  ORF Transcript_30765/g.100140 Transcript_30765/m.100140 type:complete len:270 (-) Transcript_30765:863-1672(-)
MTSPGAPSGKTACERATWPLSTRVKHSFWCAVGSPKWTVRVASVVPQSNCAPASSRTMLSGPMVRASPARWWMMAPFGPSPRMVSNETSRKPGWAWRSAWSFSAAAASVGRAPPSSTCASSHDQKRAMTTASRKCASRIPASSASFLSALAWITGEALSTRALAAAAAVIASGAEALAPARFAFPARSCDSASSARSFAPASAACAMRKFALSGSIHTVFPRRANSVTSAASSSYSFTSTPAADRASNTAGGTFALPQYSAADSSATTA